MKKILVVSALFVGTLLSAAQVNASVAFNFHQLIDRNNGKIYGELGNGDLYGTSVDPKSTKEKAFKFFNWTQSDITLTASASYFNKNSQKEKAWAYLDSGNAGLGVCHTGLADKNQCKPSSDDNVTPGEILNIAFDKRVSFDFAKTFFKNGKHRKLNEGSIEYSIDGGTFKELDLSNLAGVGKVIGNRFAFRTPTNAQQFYINALAVDASHVTVPEPSTLAIFALGIMGLASRRFKKQS